MSRHRDVRSMNYSDEYDGYDDVYGHSVEDDYCVSPSAEQFMFDRSKQQNIASFITEPDIVEDNEDIDESMSYTEKKLSELELTKLESCMKSVKNVIGNTAAESELNNKIIKLNPNAEAELVSISKESSPKHVTESSGITKDRMEHYPDAAVIMSQSPSFAIPKLSFKKRENLSGENGSNFLLTNNRESIKNLASGSPSTSFFTLGGINTNHANLASPKNSYSNDKSGETSFSSLADLTANYLQKSLHDVQQSNNKIITPNAKFTVPKLSIKNSALEGTGSKVGNAVFQVNSPYFAKSNATQNAKDSNKTAIRLQTAEDRNTVETPSSDTCLIDLSTALKEAEYLSSNSSKVNTTQTNLDSVPPLQLLNDDTGVSHPQLPITLNLINLSSEKLLNTKETVSLFGRTLCRTWTTRKPILKTRQQEHQTIKRFNFATPYSCK